MRISDWSSDVCSSDLKRRSTGHQSAHVDQSRHPAIFRVMSFNKTKNVVQDSPLSGAQIDGRIPMRRIVVIADLIGEGHDMLTNAKAHRHPVGGTTDADFSSEERVVGKEGDSTGRSR